MIAIDSQRRGDDAIADLITSAKVRIDEGVEVDNWNGGTYAHDVHLEVPAEVYLRAGLDRLPEYSTAIRERINQMLTVRNEHISEVFFEPSDDPIIDVPPPTPARNRDADLWGNTEYVRLFISHKAEDKQLAADLKEACAQWGISCFVAHEDIEPQAEWQAEIERALRSMDALVALLMPNFSDSNWTDQEIGWATGRAVPVIPVRLGRDPYGFIGKFQAIAGGGRTPSDLALQVVRILLERVNTTHQRMKTALVVCLEAATDLAHASRLARSLQSLADPPELVERVRVAVANLIQRALDRAREGDIDQAVASFSDLVSLGQSTRMMEPVMALGALLYGASGSYDTANARFDQMVRPFLDDYTPPLISQLLAQIHGNGQTYGRSRGNADHTFVRLAAERLLPDFSISRYPRLPRYIQGRDEE